MLKSHYIGRFAPSPTGYLHIGSLLSALASYADAKSHGGRWLVRIEDLDPPREIAGASRHILATLEAFGFEWDGEVVYQHTRALHYQQALDHLHEKRHVYPCFCSRKEVAERSNLSGVEGPIYSGHCRMKHDQSLSQTHNGPHAWRLKVPDERITFSDAIVGDYTQDLAREVGDFILKRKDNLWAYQLAVVVDDALSGVTHVVRGQDLLMSTPRQIFLQRCLGYATPSYAHLPLLLNAHRQKWSKQTKAKSVEPLNSKEELRRVIRYLNIPAPEGDATNRELIDWTVQHWDLARVPKAGICTETAYTKTIDAESIDAENG